MKIAAGIKLITYRSYSADALTNEDALLDYMMKIKIMKLTGLILLFVLQKGSAPQGGGVSFFLDKMKRHPRRFLWGAVS